MMEMALEALIEDGGPPLVGLVGDSGSGKTAASGRHRQKYRGEEGFSRRHCVAAG